MLNKSINTAKFPPYSLPKIYGWHLIPKQNLKETGKVYQYFGANWWDLLLSKQLPLHEGEIEVKTKDAHAIIFINLGCDEVKMTNTESGDVYNVKPGKRSTVNNTNDKVVIFRSSKRGNKMHLTKIGSIWIILLQVEQIKEGTCLIEKSDIFSDFLLMTGIPDKDQYMNTTGIENMDFFMVDDWKYVGSDTGMKSDFATNILDQWEVVNPRKRSKPPKGIPNKIHWIWFRKDPKKQEYGELKPVFYKFMDTWIERNPGFQFNLWTDNPNFPLPARYQDVVTIRGPDHVMNLINKLPHKIAKKIRYIYLNHPNVGARSDTIRQCILYFVGGMYADINDGACLAPMEKMFTKFDFIIGLEPVMYVNNAIIGSKKGHIINKYMIAWLAHNSKDFVEEWIEEYTDAEQEEKDDYIVSTTGPIAMTYAIFGVFNEQPDKLKHSLFLPSAWIYPNYWIPESPASWLKPVSITAHYDRRDYLAK
jgi:hypothetical protein